MRTTSKARIGTSYRLFQGHNIQLALCGAWPLKMAIERLYVVKVFFPALGRFPFFYRR
jgi:hypothetical protein